MRTIGKGPGVKQAPQIARIAPVTKGNTKRPQTTSGNTRPVGGSKGPSGKAGMPTYTRNKR